MSIRFERFEEETDEKSNETMNKFLMQHLPIKEDQKENFMKLCQEDFERPKKRIKTSQSSSSAS
jgi:hypothetical protein